SRRRTGSLPARAEWMRNGSRLSPGMRVRGNVPAPPAIRERNERMSYDLLIKNGRIVDGTGGPSYRGDVAVTDGKIVEIGKLSGVAKRTVDAEGRAVSPGFIDNHCHYDAQVTWDPLCSYSCDH